MTENCPSCGREPENGTPTHWIGCERAAAPPPRAGAAPAGDVCEHDECSEPKKEWSGRGARPKYCAAGHKKEK
ncbi:hypothetical protein ACIOHE_26420 [Streptomyces sp. NPDC087851]|uniref:hypothetical protein n=1 Tax=Streptomyces sp. NPDC087851 TaxID=3365810 RepID=UPI0037F8A742